MKNLTPDQCSAVKTSEGRIRVVAGHGDFETFGKRRISQGLLEKK